MKTKWSILLTLLVVGIFALAACGGNTSESESAESGEAKTIWVGPELVDCEGEGPQTCMLVKESPDGDYGLFYDQIEGFTYEPGYEYELKVNVENVENPPAGGSSLKYTLVEEVSKTPVSTESEGAADTGESDVVTMYVGPEQVECTGVAPQMCMQIKYEPDGEYQLFYDQIDGFNYEPGFNYELKVEVTDVENPPADGSSLKYTLLEEVSKTPADAEASTMPATDVQGDAALIDTNWTLSSYVDANNNMVDVLPETEITAVFGEDGSLSGSSGCNNYNTSYEVDGNNIKVNELMAATMMMCPEPIMQQETAYLANLTTAATFAVADDTLTLFDASGNPTAVFTVQQSVPLVGTNWEVLRYNNGKEAVVSVINGTKITAVFGDDGNLSGNASCNTYNAAYEVDGSSLTIGVGMTTMMACPGDGVMEQETAYLAAISTVATYSIQGDVLELRTADGALAVSYVAAEPVALTGNPWQVTSYNNGRGGAVSPIIDTELTMEFLDDGSVTGSAGCNRYFGPYTADSETIQLGPLATTRAFCPDPEGAMDQEQEFLTALQSAATYSIRDDKLDLRTSEGSIAVIAIPGNP